MPLVVFSGELDIFLILSRTLPTRRHVYRESVVETRKMSFHTLIDPCGFIFAPFVNKPHAMSICKCILLILLVIQFRHSTSFINGLGSMSSCLERLDK